MLWRLPSAKLKIAFENYAPMDFSEVTSLVLPGAEKTNCDLTLLLRAALMLRPEEMRNSHSMIVQESS